MSVTIFADASYSTTHHTAGWGAWITAPVWPQPLAIGGQIADLVDSSTEAEMRAMANALSVARKRVPLARGAEVLVRCDNINALGWILLLCPDARNDGALGGAHVKRPKVASPALAKSRGALHFFRIARQMDLALTVSHVRGHQSDDSEATRINTECDALARRFHAQRLERHHAGLVAPAPVSA